MKYLRKFTTIAQANTIGGGEGLDSPHVDLIVESDTINFAWTLTNKFNCSFTSEGYITNIVPIEQFILDTNKLDIDIL